MFIREYRRRANDGRVGTTGSHQMAMLLGQEKLVIAEPFCAAGGEKG